MDESSNALAEEVRAKRTAVDNDLELLRLRVERADPRRLNARRFARATLAIVAATGTMWLWTRRRRSVHSLEQLLASGLDDLFSTEQHLLPALQQMAAHASSAELQTAFEAHRAETQGHLERLTRAFRSLGTKPRGHGRPSGVAATIAEAERLLKRKIDPDVRDALLIATARKVEHLEIAAYGTLRAYADTLGFTHASQLLQQTLEEEQAADEKLTHLAERFIDPQLRRTAGRV